MATRIGDTTDHACGRCSRRPMRYVASLPKGPDHPQHHDIFACDNCGNVQWMKVPPGESA